MTENKKAGVRVAHGWFSKIASSGPSGELSLAGCWCAERVNGTAEACALAATSPPAAANDTLPPPAGARPPCDPPPPRLVARAGCCSAELNYCTSTRLCTALFDDRASPQTTEPEGATE